MRDAGRPTAATDVGTALVVLVVVFAAFGSSATSVLREPGGVLRWAALVALAAVVVAATRGRRPSLGLWHGAWIALVGFCFVTAAWSVEPSITAARAATLALLYVAVVAGAAVLWSTADGIESAALAVAVGVVAVFALSLLALAAPSVSIQHAWTDAATGGGSAARFRGITENPNTIASYGPIVVPLILWRILATDRRARRLWLLALGLVVAELVLSLSRIPVALVAAEAVVAAVVFARRRLVKTLVVGAVVAAAVALAAASIAVPRFGDRVTRATTVATLSGRTAAWDGATALISHRPAQGYGFGTEAAVFSSYRDAHIAKFRRANFVASFVHNSYLGAALQIGVIAAATMTFLLLVPIVVVVRLHAIDPRLRLAIALALASAAIMAVFSSYFYSVGNVITISVWLLAALPMGAAADRAGDRIGDGGTERRQRH